MSQTQRSTRTRQPHKRSALRRAAILNALRQGSTREAAAAAGGIARQTFWRWTQDEPAFADDVTMAEGQAEMAMVQAVSDAAESDWRAASWWLERRRPNWKLSVRRDWPRWPR